MLGQRFYTIAMTVRRPVAMALRPRHLLRRAAPSRGGPQGGCGAGAQRALVPRCGHFFPGDGLQSHRRLAAQSP